MRLPLQPVVYFRVAGEEGIVGTVVEGEEGHGGLGIAPGHIELEAVGSAFQYPVVLVADSSCLPLRRAGDGRRTCWWSIDASMLDMKRMMKRRKGQHQSKVTKVASPC